MEEASASVQIIRFSKTNARNWFRQICELAKSLWISGDINGLLFLVTTQAQFTAMAENRKADNSDPDQRDAVFMPTPPDALGGNASAATITMANQKARELELFVRDKSTLKKAILNSLPPEIKEALTNEHGVVILQFAALIARVMAESGQQSPRDLEETLAKLEALRLEGQSQEQFDRFCFEFNKLTDLLRLVEALPEWQRVLLFTKGLANVAEAQMGADRYKAIPASNSAKTQKVADMAAHIRIHLGNAPSTTGGAGFAGFSPKADGAEIAALQQQVADMRRKLERRGKFTCDVHGQNHTHSTEECRAEKKGFPKTAEKGKRS